MKLEELLQMASQRSESAQEARNNYLSEIGGSADNLTIIQKARLRKREDDIAKASTFVNVLSDVAKIVAGTDQGKIVIYLPGLDPDQYQIVWGKDGTLLGEIERKLV